MFIPFPKKHVFMSSCLKDHVSMSKGCLLVLVCKRAASQELSQQRRRGQDAMVDGFEIAEELSQTVSLSILLAVLRHTFQERLCLRLDGSQLIYHSRIEHSVSILLIRENPLVLTVSYRLPTTDGVTGRAATLLVVADDAAQHRCELLPRRNAQLCIKKQWHNSQRAVPLSLCLT